MVSTISAFSKRCCETKKKTVKDIVFKTVFSVVGLLVLTIFVYPLIYTVINSLKTYEDFSHNPQYAFPTKVYFGNYLKVLQNDFGRYFFNSIVIALLVVVFTVLLACMAAFVLSKMVFRGQRALEVFFLLGLMIPYQVVLLPLYLTYSQIGLMDTYWSLVLPQVAFGLPFSIQLFLAFFHGFENELIEAAIIDGCSMARVFTRIVVPLCRNVIITIATLRAIFSWNEYIFANTFVSRKKMMTVVLGLNSFIGEEGRVDWGPTFAAIAATVIPTLLIYLFLSKYMQEGLSEGAVKG